MASKLFLVLVAAFAAMFAVSSPAHAQSTVTVSLSDFDFVDEIVANVTVEQLDVGTAQTSMQEVTVAEGDSGTLEITDPAAMSVAVRVGLQNARDGAAVTAAQTVTVGLGSGAGINIKQSATGAKIDVVRTVGGVIEVVSSTLLDLLPGLLDALLPGIL